MKINLPLTADRIRNFAKAFKNVFLIGFFLQITFCGLAQTVIHNETYPNQFNVNFGTSNSSNGTFVGSTGTWTSSVNSNALCAIAVIQAYYSPVTNAIKIVNWNTSGLGAADCHAASPTVDLSTYSCAPSLDLSFKLYTYTCSSSDPNTFLKVEFSSNNGSTWTSVWSMSSAQIFAAYGANGLTTITVGIPAAYRVSGFKYRFSGYKPANEPNNFFQFIDDTKITATACSTPCTAKVTSLYFNELNGGPDLPITNGSSFTVAQLGTLYNMEAGTSGTIGSVKYTITGPTPTSNIENTTPYNSPGTGSGAWTGAAGNYSVNLKTYSAADATGTLCHDTTISFTLSNTTYNCTCTGTNVVLNPGFESGITNWSFANGTLSQGTGAVACGSFSGDLNNTSATSKAWQTIGTDLTAGTVINVSVYAGTHDNTFNNFVAVEFLDAANVVLGTSVYTQVDKILANAPAGPQLYTFSATVPTGAKYTRVAFGGTGSYTKTDQWCVTLTPPANTGSIGDRVWLDADGDGIQDATETGGITGVTVQLRNSANTVIATQTTNSTGNYLFTGLASGTYTVAFPVSISGAVVTTANVGTNDDIDSDPSQTTGITPTITLATGQSITNVDAGYCPTTLQIGNRVWNDVNNNGIDGSEAGIGSVTVNLYKDDNNDNVADGAAIATTTTNATGNYTFSNLVPGNYIVGVVTPAGFTSSTVNGGDPDNNIDSDDNGVMLVGNETRGLAITLVAGTEPDGTNTNTNYNATYDFGFYTTPNSSSCPGNLLTNASGYWGGFEAGANNFSATTGKSDFVNDGGTNSGTYNIVYSPSDMGQGSFGNYPPHSGNFQMLVHGSSNPAERAWYTNVAVIPGATYQFCAWFSNSKPTSGYDVQLKVNGAIVATTAIPSTNGVWTQVCGNYTVPSGVTNVEIAIYDLQTATFFSHFYTIDDICFYQLCNNNAGADGSTSVCDNSTTAIDLYSLITGEQTGGTWTRLTGTGGTFVAASGTFTPAAGATTSTFQYSVGSAPCTPDVSIATVNITPQANAGADGSTSVCDNSTTAINLFNLITGEQSGGVWTRLTGTGGTFVAASGTFTPAAGATTSTFQYSITGTAPCPNDVSIATVNITPQANAGADGSTSVCDNSTTAINLFNLITGEQSGGVWTRLTGTGGTFVAASGTFTPAAGATTSTFQYSITGTAPCPNDVSIATVNIQSCQLLTLGNRVWYDTDNNGIDGSEAGIANVTVNLYKDDNNDNIADGAAIATTTTNATGNYTFSNLSPGNYIVGVVTPAGYASSSVNGGDPDNNIDLDDNGQVTVGTETRGLAITLVAGTEPDGTNTNTNYNATYDFGFYAPPAPLTLGNKVFYDFNRSGMFDAGDGFVAGATVKLYLDANNDNIPDGAFIQSMPTNALGEYSFTNLAAGNYIVGVAIPATYAITVINGGDPDNNIDDDNNATTVVAGEARGMSITLASGTEPTGGNTNNTYDFGFYNPIAPPNGGQSCFSGSNPIVYAKSYWNVNQNSNTVTIRVTFSKAFVDNCYQPSGNANNWNRSHTFGNLTGSDHLQWSLKNGVGTEVLNFKQDYITANGNGYNYPSGYGTLGFSGDGSTPNPGLASDVLSFRTSITTNLNDYGYVLLTDSPPTDANYTPNPAQPNWIYDVWYEVTVKASAFGASGFGFVDVASVHASPSKTGNNTEIITNNPCAAGSISDFVWNDIDKDGIQDAGEVGLAGVVVTLYDSTSNTVLASTITDGYGNYKFSNLETNVTGKNYQVRFSLLPGYQFSPLNADAAGVPGTVNSDANITTGRTSTITLTDAVPNVTYVDAGMYYSVPARIGDYVWNDLNKNGIQEAGEPGIAGVTVMLYTSANILYRSAVTSNNGYYFFNDLAPGTYYVKVAPPIGYQVSPKDATADNLDSDIDPVTRQTPNIVVVAGTNNLTIDAGLNVTPTTGGSASLGDRVWEDLNNNNLQDPGEPGIANVTVQLFNSSNVLQATVTTDAFGNYIFNGLTPGNYYVKFTLPSGYSYVTANVGSNDAIDSDADITTGNSQTVTLIADEINTTVDAGMRRTTPGAALGDFVWYDLDKDGVQDGGSEAGVPGITVLLYNSSNVVVATTTTDINGFYLFTGLTAATTYTVGFENIPAGYAFSPNAGAVSVTNNSDVNPATGRTGNVTTGAAGSTVTYVDAGLIITPNTFDSKGSIGDRVWNDLNNNGIQDPGEPGIAGVTVTLYAANGTTVIATTTTDALGNYLFTNLDAGSYVIGFSGLPAGYVFATKDAGANDAKDSDADAGTGKTAPITLAPGEINLTIDAGARNTNTALSALGNFVWYDLNNNGIQDAGEPGAAGVSVRLTDMAGNIVKTTTTSSAGEYLFTDLPANNYFVDFGNLPAGYSIGIKNAAGSTAANNSDVNIGTSKTDVIALPAATTDLTWDMGIVSTTRASLGDFVWSDVNINGRQDAGEPGVAGVLVTLYNSSNVAIASTVTDANGFYLFSNLLPGTYSVGFSNIPASSSFTIQNAGVATAATNSDPDPTTGRTATFTLVGGQSKTDIDAGLVSLKAAVGNYVWIDQNYNGIQDAGEPPVAGVTVILYNSANVAVASAVTDANGYYLINNITVPVAGASYTIGFKDTPTGLSFTTKNALGSTTDNDSNADTVTGLTDPFTLNPGQIRLDIDAGLIFPVGCIGDRIWKDDNSNGIQDAGEVGVAGVTLVLLNAAGQPIATTTTDAFGNYKFCGLPAGDYSVRVTPPANYSLSPKTQGGDNTKDSDFDPVTYTTGTVTLGSGQTRLDIDGGLKFTQPQPASVGDRVWYDINGDGIQDANEPGVSNVFVTLYNSSGVAVASMYTDANGYYLFTNVAPGNYTVGVSLPPAMVFSPNNGAISVGNNSDINPANGRTATFTVNAGDQIRYVDAGLQSQVSTNASVGDFVWNDLNKDGVQDSGEPGIPGVLVRLVDTLTNTIIATTTTDVNGKYIFNNVPPGGYQVDFVTPAGYTTTTKANNNVTASGTDSDVDPGTQRTAKFGLTAGQRITTVDAGYWVTTPPGTGKIGDRVWHDANQNGIQDAGEPNVSGITVTLYDAGGVAIKQVTTDQNGNYLFTDLAAGNYTVGFSNLPDGFTFTTPGLGTTATGSDANPSTGRTGTITLAAGQTNLDVDAGIRSAQAGTGSIGNRVWYDLNNNGLQDAGEVGVQGATVELLDAAGNPIDKDPITPGVQPTTTITNGLGEYLFTGLGAGDYKVRFSTLPAGYAVVTKGAGTDRNLDSDGNPLVAASSTTDVVSLSANEDRLDIDLGIFNPTAPLGVIGDYVWFDSNNNGIQDPTEKGVPGVSVALLNAGGTVIATTVTDKDGMYRFVNLADATYTVQFSNLPAGFGFSPKDNGVDNLDSDADPVTGRTGSYVISGGSTILTVDAGIYSTRAALGDYVWLDANKDGIQDATESGIPGVTVILYDAAGVAITSMITDQSGRYLFSNLNPGTYTVGFGTIPGKLVFTTKDAPAAGDAADSDVDPVTGRTGSYTLVAGQVNLTVDAGLKPVIPASVGDYVWFDLNRNGIQDPGEPGVPGVIATLYNSAGQAIGSAVTDGNGYYQINNVPPGTGYYVQFTNQPDPAAPWTLQNVGGTAATNNSKADATGTTTTFDVAEGQNVTNIDAGIYRLINLSGNVWHDENAMNDNLVNKTNFTITIPTGLRVYLINGNTGLIERSTIIPASGPNAGIFNFNNININTVYRVYLTNVFLSIGSPEPGTPTVIPGGWEHTGQKNANPPLSPLGSDGVNDGRVTVPGSVNNIININFGIRVSAGDVVQG